LIELLAFAKMSNGFESLINTRLQPGDPVSGVGTSRFNGLAAVAKPLKRFGRSPVPGVNGNGVTPLREAQ
jgi:hypothetical protein